LILCAKNYHNPQCRSTEEFLEDVKRVKYIKKLISRFIGGGILKERLILNHLTILNNCFGPKFVNRILYLKMKEQFSYIKPFLVALSICQSKIYNIEDEEEIFTDLIPMNQEVIAILRKVLK